MEKNMIAKRMTVAPSPKRSARVGLRCKRLLVVGALFMTGCAGVFTPSAMAISDFFWAGNSIPAGSRGVGTYVYLYGAGYTTNHLSNVSDNVCVGAKTNGDGSGGNALPFVCGEVAPGTSMWTPGGYSNYGYPTIINNEGYGIWGNGIRNYRP
jgi:hypothetical protein